MLRKQALSEATLKQTCLKRSWGLVVCTISQDPGNTATIAVAYHIPYLRGGVRHMRVYYLIIT